VFGKLRRPAWPNEECHVPARLQQTPAEIAADRSGADNKNSHLDRSSVTATTMNARLRPWRWASPYQTIRR